MKINRFILNIFVVLVCSFLFYLPVSSIAENTQESQADTEAQNITKTSKFVRYDGGDMGKMLDGQQSTYVVLGSSGDISIENEMGIGSLYVIFDKSYGEWTLIDASDATKKQVVMGKDGFIHEFVDVYKAFGYCPNKIIMKFNKATSVDISEISVYTKGNTPDNVQKWSTPCEKADILLVSTHGDDEHLFHAGLLPYYAGELGLSVQVAYFTNHWDKHDRPHEQLDGLWAVGVTNYPIFGDLPDVHSYTLEEGIANFANLGYTEDMILDSMVTLMRRFKPLVVVGPDINGEYKHGAHMLNALMIQRAVEISTDAQKYPESAKKYGVWNVPKTYLHLWSENKITLNWDIPLESFGGKTAFKVSQDGYAFHVSQLVFPGLSKWLNGTSDSPITLASQIKNYSPCEYGLYRTTVGNDVLCTDLLENIVTYEEQEKIAKENEAKNTQSPTTQTANPQIDATDNQQNGKVNYNNTDKIIVLVILVVLITMLIAFCLMIAKKMKNKK